MTPSPTACACHGALGIAATAVPDDVLEKLRGVSIPTISGILRRLGHRNTFLVGLAPRTPIQNFVGRAFIGRALQRPSVSRRGACRERDAP
jgi:hypothetical protein